MEQLDCYLASMALDDGFWRTLHTVWRAVEQLGVAREAVSDRLLENAPNRRLAVNTA